MGNSSSKSQSEQRSQPSVFVPKTFHLQKLIKNRYQNNEKQKCIIQTEFLLWRKKGQMLVHLFGYLDSSSVVMNEMLDS